MKFLLSRCLLLFLVFTLSANAIVDTNNNGVSDLWETFYNGGNLFTTFDRTADPDGDGWTNAQEATTGTDPFNANPPAGVLRPDITYIPAVYLPSEEEGGPPVLATPEAVTITWPTLSGKQYTLLVSPDLASGSWLTVGDPRTGSGSVMGNGIPLTQFDGSTPASLFWRVKIEDIDTDNDHLSDAEEDQLGTDPTNSDTDEDGLGDGPEVIGGTNPNNQNSDQDGTPDGLDVAPDDPLINWAKEDPFLFAQFPVSGQGRPIHVNDEGRVLFMESLWTNGSSQVLQASNGTELTRCRPRSISDNGFILGVGDIDLSGDDGKSLSYCLVTWPSPDSAPVPLRIRGEYVTPVFSPGFVVNLLGAPEIMFADLQVNGNGEFVAHYAAKTSSESGGKTYYNLTVDDDPQGGAYSLYRGTPGSATLTTVKALPDSSVYAPDTDHVVTLRPDKIFTFGEMALPAHYNRIIKLADGRFAALAGYGQLHEAEYPRILVGQTFVESKGLGKIVDFAADIKLAPHDYWWINHNGRTEKGQKKNPGLVPVWDDPLTCKFADVSRRGWTLATQEDSQNMTAMLGAPLIPVTGGAAIGVDNLSATTQSSSWDKPAETVGNKNEFWAMVPAGDTIQFTLKSPATSLIPLLINTSGTIGATPATITVPQTTLTLSAPASAAGTEHVIPFKLAGIASSTVPLKAKVMKPRVVSLSVWPLQRPAPHAGTMPAIPDKAEFEAYLNGIYKPQLNVTFDVTINPTSTISPDPGVSFTVADPPTQAQKDIAATRLGGDIRLFILGSYDSLYASGPFGYGGWTNPAFAFTWVGVGDLKGSKPENEKKEHWLNTVAHEIGHVLLNAGHPDDSKEPGPAALPGTDRKIRLMFSGWASNAPPANRRWLVKAEWDKAEAKLMELLGQ